MSDKKYYVTKYWATKGIICYPESVCEHYKDGCIRVNSEEFLYGYTNCLLGEEIFLNLEDAVRHTEIEKAKRIENLQEEIESLKEEITEFQGDIEYLSQINLREKIKEYKED